MINVISTYGPWFWLGIFVICCIIEAFTFGLTTIWAAIAALPLIFIAKTGMALKWQFLIFVLLTLALIVFTRPFAVKKLKVGKDKTNVNTMVGEEILITKAIEKFQKGEGKARNGVIWSCTSSNGEEIAEGTVCKVTAVSGNTITVEKINS